MTPEIGAKAYLAKLKKQITCYEEIIFISKVQQKLINGGNFNKLKSKVAQREKVLQRLDILQYVIKAYGDYWNNVYDSVSDELNTEIAVTLDQLHEVVAELAEYDKELKELSVNELNRINKELAIIRSNKVKTKAFRKPIIKQQARFVNKVSASV